jgi:ATP-dependent protease HslVU (ClpYQ) peptidase subunit
MTCILVVKDKKSNKIYMAGDRLASWNMGLAQSMPRPKIRKTKDFLVGACGDGSLCTLVVDRLYKLYSYESDIKNQDDFLFEIVIPKLTELLIFSGYVDSAGSLLIPKKMTCEAILVIKGKVFSFNIEDTIISFDEMSLPYAAGSGSKWAWGAYEAYETCSDLGIEYKIHSSMSIASKYAPGCNNEIDIISED